MRTVDLKNGITFIGSGNVAWHLSHKFKRVGVRINKVLGRNPKSVVELATAIGTDWGVDILEIPPGTDMVIICVSDHAIADVARTLSEAEVPMVHTAGSIPISTLLHSTQQAGVFYPFQTLSKSTSTEDISMPICIEASSPGMKNQLKALAHLISEKVFELDSEQRKQLHLSGIVANNFTNFLFTQAYKFLESNSIPTELLHPIIHQTARLAQTFPPEKIQTGPARRGSQGIIDTHVKMLEPMPDLKEIYAFLSDKITKFYTDVNG